VTFLDEDRTTGIDIRLVRRSSNGLDHSAANSRSTPERAELRARSSVHDLRARFGSGLTEATENHVVVIAWIGMKTVGILVDAVSDIVSVPNEEIKACRRFQCRWNGSFVSGLVSSGDDHGCASSTSHALPQRR
jgi:purine-binding chemotaxis protein CheW